MVGPSPRIPETRLVYEGTAFRIEFYMTPDGAAPAEEWLETLSLGTQQKFAAFSKHLAETDQIFEFKVDADRLLCFFFVGKRLILTHGFPKSGDKTPRREIERAETYKREFEQGGQK